MKTLVQIDGMKLRHHRLRNEMTLEELGKKIGLHKVNVNKWELGTRPVPVKYWDKLCEILGVILDDIRKPQKFEERIDEKIQFQSGIEGVANQAGGNVINVNASPPPSGLPDDPIRDRIMESDLSIKTKILAVKLRAQNDDPKQYLVTLAECEEIEDSDKLKIINMLKG